MLYRNGPSMQVGKYFSCLLSNVVSNDDIIVTSQQRFVSGVVVCQLVCSTHWLSALGLLQSELKMKLLEVSHSWRRHCLQWQLIV